MPKQAAFVKPAKPNVFSIGGSYAIVPCVPLEIGHRRQLLMDDAVVEDRWDCVRTVHQPVKSGANPLLTATRPCEIKGPAWISVLYDTQHALFRLWTINADLGNYEKGPFSRRCLYYESRDGLEWTAPDLGLIEFEGNTSNNIFTDGNYLYDSVHVIEMPADRRQRGRFARLYTRAPIGGAKDPNQPAGGLQIRIAFSNDGVRWEDQPENPVFYGRSDHQNNIVYNPERSVFMMYRRCTVNAQEIRRIAYSESPDLIHWSQPRSVMIPDELDPSMFYTMTVDRYQDIYLGFLHNHYVDRDVRLAKACVTDAQLAWSRDGIHWSRHPKRPMFLEVGHIPSYDWGMVRIGKGLIERPDELWLYYIGCAGLHKPYPAGAPWYLCLAKLRKDGFVSVDAGNRQGALLTRPVRCPGGQLHINARTKPGGSIRVAIRRGDGEHDGLWLDGLGFEQSQPFTGDSINHVVRWTGSGDPARLQDQTIRLHFRLENAELYSFWFED